MNIGSSAVYSALECFRRADDLMMRAVNSASGGDIIDMAMAVKMAKIAAESGGALARASLRVEESLIDILA